LNGSPLRFFPLLIVFFYLCRSAEAQVTVLPHAHAHNDYKHRHPLCDAMHCGFTSFEADIFLHNGKLIVAHVSPAGKKKTLEELYLQPLYDSIMKNKGWLYANYPHPVILLIDIKTDASKTYSALKLLLDKYTGMLSFAENGKLNENAVTVILTGNKPYTEVKQEGRRNAFIDEPLSAVTDLQPDSLLFPLASAKYSSIMSWKGKGPVNADEEWKLKTLITLAHHEGKKVRLWASPENKEVWDQLLKWGVDLINTDELEELQEFFGTK
jgi:hypothetical protein